jgi:hypothetical protein
MISFHVDVGPQEPSIVFEFFEASASSAAVLAAIGPLEWHFPGSTIAVPATEINNDEFSEQITNFIERASLESIGDFAAKTYKAGSKVDEDRDTAHPALLTSLFATILQVNGQRLDIGKTRKHVRDSVVWNNAEKPWRRLPYYLVLRVCIQRYLAARLPARCGQLQYKFFISILLSQYLEFMIAAASPETVETLFFAKAKIARKLLKLDAGLEESATKFTAMEAATKTLMLSKTLPRVENTLQRASALISSIWTSHIHRTAKIIEPLPQRAPDEDLSMSLYNCYGFLDQTAKSFRLLEATSETSRPNQVSAMHQANDQVTEFMKPFRDLCDLESRVPVIESDEDTELAVPAMTSWIRDYTEEAFTKYKGDSELLSTMLLTVMDAWCRLDIRCCEQWPLLMRFHPVFSPDMLDALCVESPQGLVALKAIRDHLQQRFIKCGKSLVTIFSDPDEGCFADCLFDDPACATECQKLLECIETSAKKVRDEKRTEWEQKSQQYEELMKAYVEEQCEWKPTINSAGDETISHEPTDCSRCKKGDRATRIRIQSNEEPLPQSHVLKRVVVAELQMPKVLAAYRDITQYIVHKLGRLNPSASGGDCCITLLSYAGLQQFADGKREPNVILGSFTKPHTGTHRHLKSFPVPWDHVQRENGLKLAYYDRQEKVWPGRSWCKPIFSQHIELQIPASSPLQPFIKVLRLSRVLPGLGHPRSNEVLASQAQCPQGVNVLEFMAYQRLCYSGTRRWEVLLRELSSTNINISSEAAANLVHLLVIQVGPMSSIGSVIPISHDIFHDNMLCMRLVEELDRRLDSISTNWTEYQQMDAVTCMIVRLTNLMRLWLDPGVLIDRAAASLLQSLGKLKKKSQGICLTWMRQLREESRQAMPEKVKRSQNGALWAALQLKRLLGHLNDPSEQELEHFVEASIVVRNILTGRTRMPLGKLRIAVLRDVRQSHTVGPTLASRLANNPEALLAAIGQSWPAPQDSNRRIDRVQERPNACLRFHVSEKNCHYQQCDYSCSEGILLVQGHPIGVLPPQYRDLDAMRQLFGDQVIMTVKSNKPGMAYRKCSTFFARLSLY